MSIAQSTSKERGGLRNRHVAPIGYQQEARALAAPDGFPARGSGFSVD
jgi:hypothetical protein